MCNKGITQFHLPLTQRPYLPLLTSRKASPPFGWYSLCLPTKGWPGWVGLGGWLHTEINVLHRELNPDTVTRRSTNRARHEMRCTWYSYLFHINWLYCNSLIKFCVICNRSTDVQVHGTTKLVPYFTVMNYCLISRTEKLMVSDQFMLMCFIIQVINRALQVWKINFNGIYLTCLT